MTSRPPKIDVHQHLWTEPLLGALAARDHLPFVRRTDRIAVVHCAGEQAWTVDLETETARRRAELVGTDGLDVALVALSSPIGIEALPRDDARELIEAHLAGIDDLPPAFAGWGPVALDHPQPSDVVELVARGCVGVSVAAGALAEPEALDDLGAVLECASNRQAPVFVHPGPAPGQRSPATSLNQPLWWPAVTHYVAQMQAAWLTFATIGRREHPRLRIVFAMLAGGAPLLSERLAARGGPPIDLHDPLTFYESSSYGPAAIQAMAQCVGTSQLLYGSDRPVLEPAKTSWDPVLQTNASWLLAHTQAVAA